MKGLVTIFLAFAILVASCSAASLVDNNKGISKLSGTSKNPLFSNGLQAQKPMAQGKVPTFCDVCITFMGQAVNQIINIILNVGIPGDCQALCQLLPGGSVDQALCEIYCDLKGINFFINLLNNFNPDFIAICTELEICPKTMYAKARITQLAVAPSSGPQGTTFKVNLDFAVTNTTGTVMIILQVNPPDAPFLQGTEIAQSLTPGNYHYSWDVSTQPAQDEPFDPGQYQTIVAICEGTCGSTGPYYYQLDQKQTVFTITQ